MKETVTFNALLRLPKDKSREEKLVQVDRVLSIFGLSDVQNSMIGSAEKRGISGGERKRVSICNELVSSPRLIFMDEPTSKLDSFTALTICEALKEYVERGRETILMTIHQPRLNLLRLFSAIIILSQGKIVFFGSVITLLFFTTVTLAFSIVVPLLPIFVLDRVIMKKERYASTYRLSMAYLARFLSLLPSRLFLSTIFAFIVYYIIGLRTDGFQYFIIFWAVLMDLVLASITLGLLIAASVSTVQLGEMIGSLIIVISLLFAGNFTDTNNPTWILRWIQYISIVFYSYEALIQNELAGRTFNGVTGDSILKQYTLAQLPIVACAMALLGLGLVFLFFGYIALRISTKPKIRLDTKPAPPPPLNTPPRAQEEP